MIDAGIHPGDYVMIRKQNTAEIGDIVVALDQGVNNLKVLGFNHNKYNKKTTRRIFVFDPVSIPSRPPYDEERPRILR